MILFPAIFRHLPTFKDNTDAPQTCCKLVHLGFGACMRLFFCELSLCNRREHAFQFSCLWWWESKLSQEKLSWLCIQRVASSFEAVSKEMYWWAASSWQQSHDFVSSHFPTSSNIQRQHGCTPNMLQACAPWFWSLHAPVLLRAQPVQQERTCVPVFLFMVMGVKIITRETFLVVHSKGSLEFWGC